jgi:MFS family permease
MTCISVVPLASDIVRDLSPSPNPSKSASVLLVTIWELGEAAGPLLIAPLSEMFGRYPVMNVANLLFIAAGVLAATSESVPQFVVARMLNGLAVAGNVLNPAIVGDMFPSDERGGALSLLFLAPLIGGAFGPMIGSAVADLYGWRTVVWMAVALAAGCEVLFLCCFRETYKVAILRKRVRKMARHPTGSGKTFKTAFDEAERLSTAGFSEWQKLRDAVLRPAIVLCGSGVLLVMSLFNSVVFTFFYIYSTSFSDILIDVYKLSPVAVGSCFTIFCKPSPLFTSPTSISTVTNPLHSNRLHHQRNYLQPVPRPHLRPHALHAQRRRQTRVPPPAGHRGRIRAARDGGSVRVGGTSTATAGAAAVLRVRHGHRPHARHHPCYGVRRRCVWTVLGVGDDGDYCYALLGEYLLAVDDGAVGGEAGVWVGVFGAGGV